MTGKPVALEGATGLPPDGPDTCAARYLLGTIQAYLTAPPHSEFQKGFLACAIHVYREACLGGCFDQVHPDEPPAVTAADTLLLDPEVRNALRH
jgi:hypothetical protein